MGDFGYFVRRLKEEKHFKLKQHSEIKSFYALF